MLCAGHLLPGLCSWRSSSSQQALPLHLLRPLQQDLRTVPGSATQVCRCRSRLCTVSLHWKQAAVVAWRRRCQIGLDVGSRPSVQPARVCNLDGSETCRPNKRVLASGLVMAVAAAAMPLFAPEPFELPSCCRCAATAEGGVQGGGLPALAPPYAEMWIAAARQGWPAAGFRNSQLPRWPSDPRGVPSQLPGGTALPSPCLHLCNYALYSLVSTAWILLSRWSAARFAHSFFHPAHPPSLSSAAAPMRPAAWCPPAQSSTSSISSSARSALCTTCERARHESALAREIGSLARTHLPSAIHHQARAALQAGSALMPAASSGRSKSALHPPRSPSGLATCVLLGSCAVSALSSCQAQPLGAAARRSGCWTAVAARGMKRRPPHLLPSAGPSREAATMQDDHHFCRWHLPEGFDPQDTLTAAFPGCSSRTQAAHQLDSSSPKQLRASGSGGVASCCQCWRLAVAVLTGWAELKREAACGLRRGEGMPSPPAASHKNHCLPPPTLAHTQEVFAAVFGSPTTSNNTAW